MHIGTPLALTALALALPGLAAQGFVVAPQQYTNVAGPSSYTGCWHFTDRTQQIHGDLRNQPRTFNSIAWRRSAYPAPDANSVARTIDAEFFSGEADMANAGPTFLANYVTPRTNMVVRKSLSLPNWVNFQGAPSPFTFVVPFDQPYPYTGAGDYAWEVIVWNNTGNSNYLADACAGIPSLPGAVQYVGAGCLATGSALPIVQTVGVEAWRGPDRFVLDAVVSNLRPNAASALLLGVTNPNLVVPGLCTSVHTDSLVSLPGTSSALGAFVVGPLTFGHQGALVGQKIWVQSLSADAGQSFPWVLSNAASVEMPDLPPPLPLVKLVRAAQQPGAATGVVYEYRGQIVRLGY